MERKDFLVLTLSPLKAKPLEWLPDFRPNTIMNFQQSFFDTVWSCTLQKRIQRFLQKHGRISATETQGFGTFQPVNSRKSPQQEQDQGSLCLPAPLSVFQRDWVIRLLLASIALIMLPLITGFFPTILSQGITERNLGQQTCLFSALELHRTVKHTPVYTHLLLCFSCSGFLLGQPLLEAALELISLGALGELLFQLLDLLLAPLPLC